MNNDIKVNLNIVLQGRTILSEDECKRLQDLKMRGYEDFSINYLDRDKKRVVLNMKLRTCKPASQSINISKTSYIYMISDECPESFPNPKYWVRLSKKQRLEYHLKELTQSMGGLKFTYKVFED